MIQNSAVDTETIVQSVFFLCLIQKHAETALVLILILILAEMVVELIYTVEHDSECDVERCECYCIHRDDDVVMQ